MALIQTVPLTPSSTTLYVKLTLVALMWGGTFVAGRSLAGQLDPLAAATGRFGIALVLLLALAWRMEGGLPRLKPSQALLTLGLGATGVVLYNLFFFAALSEMPASRTALFVAFNPIAVAVVMAIAGREKLTVTGVSGIIIALFGALVVISQGEILSVARNFGKNFGMGEGFMCGAVLSWVAYTVLGRKILTELSPLAATTYAAIWGFTALFMASVCIGSTLTLEKLQWDSMAALFYLAVGGTVLPFV